MVQIKRKIVRFDISDILPIGLTLVVTGIGIAYGLDVMGDVSEDFCSGSYETYSGSGCYACNATAATFNASDAGCYNTTASGAVFTASGGGSAQFNASNNAITGVAKLPEKLPIIVNVIIASIIIGILVRYLMVRFG